MKLSNLLGVLVGLVILGFAIAIVVACPWILLVAFASPLFMGVRTR